MERLQDYLSCKIKFSNNKKHAWLGQPHLIKNLENKFGGLVNDNQSHKTPGTPKFLIVRPTEENEKVSIKYQWEYWSGIGMLLCLIKHLCLDLANATRELSKANDGANPATYKKLLHVIKYAIDTKNLGFFKASQSPSSFKFLVRMSLSLSADLTNTILTTPSSIIHIFIPYVHMLSMTSSCNIACHNYGTHVVDSYHDWIPNNYFHTSQKLHHEHHFLNSLR